MAEVRIATFNLENFDETAVGNDAGESLNPSAQSWMAARGSASTRRIWTVSGADV